MKLKFVVAIVYFFTSFMCCFAQNVEDSALYFTASTINYGTIAEDGGVVTAYVDAINRGDTPIYIEDIITTCGCTKADYPREAINPNQTIRIGISFDPMNRPGRIERKVMVVASDSEKHTILNMVGYVQARERTIDEIYPFDMGDGLRLHTTSRALGYLEHGKESVEYIEYVNTSDQTIYIGVESILSSGALTISYPEYIAPNESGVIVVRYELSENSTAYGSLVDNNYLIINGKRSQYVVVTSAIAVDNFDSVDDISAPRADISKNIIKFGEVNCVNSQHTDSFKFKNVGGSRLELRSVESSSEALHCEVLSRGAEPEESVEVVVTLDSSKIADIDDIFTARIRIITNDPIRPMQTVRVTAIPMW